MIKLLNNISIRNKLLGALGILFILGLISGLVVDASVTTAKKNLTVLQNVSELRNTMADINTLADNVPQTLTAFLNSGDMREKEKYETDLLILEKT